MVTGILQGPPSRIGCTIDPETGRQATDPGAPICGHEGPWAPGTVAVGGAAVCDCHPLEAADGLLRFQCQTARARRAAQS